MDNLIRDQIAITSGTACQRQLLGSPETVVRPHIGVSDLCSHAVRLLARCIRDQYANTYFDVEDVLVPFHIGGDSAFVITAKIDDPNEIESFAQHPAESAESRASKEASVRNESDSSASSGMFRLKKTPERPAIEGNIKIGKRIERTLETGFAHWALEIIPELADMRSNQTRHLS